MIGKTAAEDRVGVNGGIRMRVIAGEDHSS
jgi:hypothetical protein